VRRRQLIDLRRDWRRYQGLHVMHWMLTVTRWGEVGFAILAAVLWWRSARVRLPEQVAPVSYISLDPTLEGFADGLRRQSSLSKWAAIYAGIAAALQALSTGLGG
jgi:hypothetical protein